MTVNYKIVASIIGVAILLALTMSISYWAFDRFEETAETRKRTNVIINHAHELLSELKDVETGQRGYLLTGDKAFLEPYLAVYDDISDHLKQLRQLTTLSAAQKHLITLTPLVDAKLKELAHLVELRNDLNDLLSTVKSGSGKRLMDSIRAEMHSFIQIEDNALVQQDAAFQLNMHRLFSLIVTISQLTLLFAFAFGYLIYREKKHQFNHLVHLKPQHLLKTQQQTNVALEESQERLLVTLNSIGDAVIATDAQGRVTLLNPLFERFTGWTQAEATGRPVEDILHIIDQQTLQPTVIPVKQALATGTIQSMANHTVLIARGGSECIIADSCAPIRNLNGKVVGTVVVFRDVTQDYAAKQILRDNTARIQAILNTVADGIITFHACGGIVETINPAIERMFGYSADEVVGQNLSLLIPELDDDKCNICLNFNARDTLHAIDLQQEVIGRRKDGSVFPLEIALSEMWLGNLRYFTGILRDITARKQAIEEGHRFFVLSQEIQCLAGFDGYFKSLNSVWEKTLGYTKEELYARPFIEYIHPDDRQATLAVTDSLKAGSDLISFENRFVGKDGSCRWFLWSATAVVKDQMIYGSARDITERKHSETEQKRLYERSQLALDAGCLGDWSWDAASNLVTLGARSAQMYGFPEGILVTREQMRECLSPGDADYARKAWDQALAEHTAYNNEYRINRVVNGQCWVAMTGRGSYAEDGTVLGMNGVMQDITERKHTEEKIRENDRRFRNMIDALPIAIYTTDAKGFITYFNPAAVELSGRTPVLGVDQWCISWKLFLPDGTPLPHDQCPMALTLKERQVIRGAEALAERPDGTRVLYTPYPTPLFDVHGKLVGGINMLMDITEHRRAELELHEAIAAAEKANRAKSEFLSSMSHELRTPLNAILGFAQLLEASTPPPTANQMLRIEQIIKAGWYLLELINEILDLALVESGKLSLTPEPVVLIEIMRECQAMIEPQAQQRDIKLMFLPFDHSWFAYSDRIRLKQVLINLLSNAVKYNCVHGTIEVSCSANSTGHLRINIKDSGAGLDPEQLAQLFQPFNRLGQEHGSEEGTGIGLVVTKKLVELMGGSIGVQSTVGVGSEFWIEVIRDVTPQHATDKTSCTELARQDKASAMLRTLLYVEDNPAT